MSAHESRAFPGEERNLKMATVDAMSAAQWTSEGTILVRAVGAASSFTRLTAVPTLRWCEEASGHARHITGRGPARLTVGRLSAGGHFVDVEDTGAVGAAGEPIVPAQLGAPLLPADTPSTSHTGGNGHEEGGGSGYLAKVWMIRDTLARGGTGGGTETERVDPDGVEQGANEAQDMLEPWRRLGANTVLVARVPLTSDDPARCLVLEVGAAVKDQSTGQSLLGLLRAVVPVLHARVFIAFGSVALSAANRLTGREQEVLNLLALGHSVKSAADELGRSPHTVHDHVKALHRKLNASSRGELIARALGHIKQKEPTTRVTVVPGISAGATPMRVSA